MNKESLNNQTFTKQTLIKNIFSYFKKNSVWLQKKWIIVGKGPSISLLDKESDKDFYTCTLNDAIREVNNTTIAHFVDFDAFLRCQSYLDRAEYVVLPWYPHFDNTACDISLEVLVSRYSNLQDLLEKDKLCWYDLSSSPIRYGNYPMVSATYFSSEAALDMLAIAGVKTVRSVGIDGGKSYSCQFSDLSGLTLLSNKQESFDKQFLSFPKIIAKTGVDYGPIGLDLPIKVFVACTESELLAAQVLEYSIKKHSSVSVSVRTLYDSDVVIPTPKDPKNQARTPFSFQRFIIPKECNYKGKAIYLDADMLVFKDIKDLWSRNFDDFNILSTYADTSIGRKPQFSVMLMNCENLDWDINSIVDQLDSGSLTYEKLMYDFSLANFSSNIEPDWNSLELYSKKNTALLHYTDMNTQPWISTNNPLGYLWVKVLRNAVDDGIITRNFLEEEIKKGHVRPSLLYQIDHNIDDPILLPNKMLIADKHFRPPYISLIKHNGTPWINVFYWIRAKLRSIFQNRLIYKFVRILKSKFTKIFRGKSTQ